MLLRLLRKFATTSCSINKTLSVVRHVVNGIILADELDNYLFSSALRSITLCAINPSALPKPRYPCTADPPPAMQSEDEIDDEESPDEVDDGVAEEEDSVLLGAIH